jgi:hypothetical protein
VQNQNNPIHSIDYVTVITIIKSKVPHRINVAHLNEMEGTGVANCTSPKISRKHERK